MFKYILHDHTCLDNVTIETFLKAILQAIFQTRKGPYDHEVHLVDRKCVLF